MEERKRGMANNKRKNGGKKEQSVDEERGRGHVRRKSGVLEDLERGNQNGLTIE